MDFSICFLAGGQMFPGTLAVPCAAIAAASPTTPVATSAKTTRVRFMVWFMATRPYRARGRAAYVLLKPFRLFDTVNEPSALRRDSLDPVGGRVRG